MKVRKLRKQRLTMMMAELGWAWDDRSWRRHVENFVRMPRP